MQISCNAQNLWMPLNRNSACELATSSCACIIFWRFLTTDFFSFDAKKSKCLINWCFSVQLLSVKHNTSVFSKNNVVVTFYRGTPLLFKKEKPHDFLFFFSPFLKLYGFLTQGSHLLLCFVAFPIASLYFHLWPEESAFVSLFASPIPAKNRGGKGGRNF